LFLSKNLREENVGEEDENGGSYNGIGGCFADFDGTSFYGIALEG
jgi:hypothetical protein